MLQTKTKPKFICIRAGALAALCGMLNVGCDTPEGARAVAGLLPRINVSGPGFGYRSFGVPPEAFMSARLRFQTAVVHGDVSAASRYIKPEWAGAPIKGYPPVYYAAATGNPSMIRLLVRNGASVRGSYGGHSLAYVAAAFGHAGAANEISQLGGGSHSDVARGHALFAQGQEMQRKQAAMLFAGALLFLNAAAHSSAGSSGGYSDQQHTADALHDQAHASGNVNSVYY
jgi:hypothetical protein